MGAGGASGGRSVDPSTGAATPVGVIGVTTPRGQSGGVTDLGIGNDGTIFGTMLDALISIDPGTGQGSLVGSYVNNTGIEAIDVDLDPFVRVGVGVPVLGIGICVLGIGIFLL